MLQKARRWKSAAPILLFAVLSAIVWWKVLFGGQALFLDDLYRLFYPNSVFFQQSLRSFEFPFWNPHLYSGVPFMANLQSAVFYPFSYFHLFLDFAQGLAINVWVHTLLAAAFMFLLAKELGISEEGSILSGVVFGFNANFILRWAFPSNLYSYIWLPLILYFLTKAYRGSKRAILGASAAVALQVFAGHPQFALYSACALLLWALFSDKPLRAFSLLALLFVLSFSLAAVQLIPSLNLALQSVRNGAADFHWASPYSIVPMEFLGMLLAPQWIHYLSPPSGGDFHTIAFYFGPISLICACLALKDKTTRWAPYAAMAVLGTLLSLGSHFFLYGLLFNHIRFFQWFRFPAQALYLVCFSLPILAGIGADQLKPKFRKIAWIACAADLVLFALFCITTINPSLYDTEPPIAQFFKQHDPLARAFLTPKTRNTFSMTGKNELAAWFKFKDALTPNLGMASGLYLADGQEEMRYQRYENILDQLDRDPMSHWMDVLSIRYILSFWSLPSKFHPIAVFTTKVFENPSAFPKAYFAQSPAQFSEDTIIEYDRHKPTVEIAEYRNNRVVAKLNTPESGWLILTDAYDSGWTGTVNSMPALVRRVNAVQRGVEVPAGHSVVEFDYLPLYFHLTALWSALAWIAVLLWILSSFPALRAGSRRRAKSSA